MRKHLLFSILSLLLCTPLSAQLLLSDSAKIYLLTCTPGTEVWSKYGHTGIRVLDQANQLDIVFNYGIFSLMDDGFYLKFIKGDTYYQLGIEPYTYFLRFYKRIGRTTYQQELNLTPAQKQQVFDALQTMSAYDLGRSRLYRQYPQDVQMVVCDVVFNPAMPPFLREAEKRGARVIPGLGMLVNQAARNFEIWTGVQAPKAVMEQALRREFEA